MLTTKKVFLEENTKDVARPSLDKEITGTTHELSHLVEARNTDGIIPEETPPAGTKRRQRKWDGMKED